MAVKGATAYLLFLYLLTSPGLFLFGYHIAELNAPQAVTTCKSHHLIQRWTSKTKAHPYQSTIGLPQCIPMTAAQFGFVSSILTVGGLVGALLGSTIGNRFGRLRGMLCAAAAYVVGATAETLSPGVTVLAAGRLLSGVGAGLALTICPIFIAETAPPDHKGFFGAGTQVMINVGIISTQTLALFLSRGSLWRIILAVGAATAVAQIAGLLLAGQESPKWLAGRGKHTRALQILNRIRPTDADLDDEIHDWGLPDDDDITLEHESLLRRASQASNTKSDSDKSKGLLAVLLDSETRPAVIAVIMVHAAQQLCGINSIVMYGVDLLSGLLSTNSALLSIAVAAVNLAVTMIAAPLPDKWGRRTCLLLSITGMGTSSLALAFAMSHSIAPLSVIACLAFVASFALGLGPVPFILSSELVGSDAVASTQSWALAANYIANYLVAQCFPVLNERLGGGIVYTIFAGLALFFGSFLAWILPESRGKSNVDEIWGRKKPAQRED